MSFLVERYVFRPGCCEVVADCNSSPGQLIVRGPCIYCRAPQEIRLQADDLQKFLAGGFAQDCFPYLTASEREFLLSGICGACWDDIFPPEGNDDD